MSRLSIVFALPAAALLAITTWATSAQADPPSPIYLYSTGDGHTRQISNAKLNKCYHVLDAYNGSNYTAMTALIYSDKGCGNKKTEDSSVRAPDASNRLVSGFPVSRIAGSGVSDVSSTDVGSTGRDPAVIQRQSPTGGPAAADARKVAKAQTTRGQNLAWVENMLNMMIALPPTEIARKFPAQVTSVEKWLRAKPTDTDYIATLTKARDLIEQNRAMSADIIRRTGKTCVADPNNWAFSTVGHPKEGIQLCGIWFDAASDQCRVDVLIHETNHLIGMNKEGQDRSSVTTPDMAFDNADTMAQFVNAIKGNHTDNCFLIKTPGPG